MDPLRTFSDLIRSLAQRTAVRSENRASIARPAQEHRQFIVSIDKSSPPAQLRDKIRRRLLDSKSSSLERRREFFVETVLLHELGDGLVSDPAFVEVVRQVADHLGSQGAIAARLNELLDTLGNESG